ncbi:hypothetical protein Ate01nite_45060 [Actinoplanes teichomyceticus]|nr:hypothetical protein Ate01nite_45060 [Actinoplanes teichomyceticus]
MSELLNCVPGAPDSVLLALTQKVRTGRIPPRIGGVSEPVRARPVTDIDVHLTFTRSRWPAYTRAPTVGDCPPSARTSTRENQCQTPIAVFFRCSDTVAAAGTR